MITDHAIDEALIEIMRTKRALESLRAMRKAQTEGKLENGKKSLTIWHAAAKRASMDLTRSLAKLRAGK